MDFAVSRWEARRVCAALLLTILEQLLELASAPRASTRLTPGAWPGHLCSPTLRLLHLQCQAHSEAT